MLLRTYANRLRAMFSHQPRRRRRLTTTFCESAEVLECKVVLAGTPVFTGLSAASTIDENSELIISGVIIQPDYEPITVAVDWGTDASSDSDVSYYVVSPNESFLFSYRYYDDNPSASPLDVYTISLSAETIDAADSTIYQSSTTISTSIQNLPPTFEFFEDASCLETNCGGGCTQTGSIHGEPVTGFPHAGVGVGDPFRFFSILHDSSPNDAVFVTIAWGDGSTTSVPPQELNFDYDDEGVTINFIADHPYDTAGTYSVVVTAEDDDQGVVTSSFTVNVGDDAPLVAVDLPPATPPSPFTGGGTPIVHDNTVLIIKTDPGAGNPGAWDKPAEYYTTVYNTKLAAAYPGADNAIVVVSVSTVAEFNEALTAYTNIVHVVIIGHSDGRHLFVGSGNAAGTNISSDGGPNDVAPGALDWSHIRQSPGATQITILGCNAAGYHTFPSIAQQISDAAGVGVKAATDYVNFDSDGRAFIRGWRILRGGSWQTFVPTP